MTTLSPRPTIQKILYIRLPCNPIFPIGVVYLSDHVHKLFPQIQQRIFDMGTFPPLDFRHRMLKQIDEFQPDLLVFSWRDIQVYAPVNGRAGNLLQHSFEFLYSPSLVRKAKGSLNSARLIASYYGEIWRNTGLVRQGIHRARQYNPEAQAILGGGAVSVFYEQLGRSLPKGTIVSVGEGETLLEKVIQGSSLATERCYRAGEETPRENMIHEAPQSIQKTACDYTYIEEIWPEFEYYLDGGDFYIGVQTKRGCPHNCCYCIYTVIEGKQVRINPADEVVREMLQLYERGVRNFWFTDAQFIPARLYIQDAVELLQKILDAGMTDIHWAAYIRADNLTPELADLMVKTGMNYFEIGITSGSQELVRKMRMGYSLTRVLDSCRYLKQAGYHDVVSVNYSFNVIDEREDTIRQTIRYHRELEAIFGVEKVEPAIFFIGLQPHTHLEDYALKQGILHESYNPMTMMPWTARKLLWNPEPLGSFFGEVCLEAWDTHPNDFGRTVLRILENRLGMSSLEDALSAPLSGVYVS